jgi:Cu(I)/Ag(I) efflux system periplasmic protein CusF
MKKTLSIAVAALTIGFMSSLAMADSDHGSMKEIKGHEMNMAGVQAKGKINGINDHKINISHDMIKELGWPPMKMDFAVADGVDISQVSEGQDVEFTLGKGKNGMYEIMGIKAAH